MVSLQSPQIYFAQIPQCEEVMGREGEIYGICRRENASKYMLYKESNAVSPAVV